mmetsp:Transcript_33811/g.88817  ORF Transcript_33811/g.88817 Transcript_33811/m.88817 type:complete len:186 (+) Transcript_33811:305-862(+)|eukprot:CAMPEP_0182918818 /NCGR_PEP_ID=MMETSP0105_2-20130417/2317_1 /TAXON_ID=81532 ORGANISM="Acanthoeca-like sp., Strain 10tr" /NCGR_SAMPLE_ID=MMETSP0105_2 /ASSEMBLY_ACC=CAM_ASM_000205 /LENGTH=185 /DNA_ID=CAMNT_0025055937 /DNA_START=239 /DNA_END=796 /DNA_ORIENTATION=-
MAGEQMVKTNERTPIGEASFVLGMLALLLATTATILPRMALTEENNVKTSWGVWRKSEGDDATSVEIQCSDLGAANRACVACQAFSIVAIGAGVIGLAASIRLHEIFVGFDKVQIVLLLQGAGLAAMIVFSVFDAAIINGASDDNPLHNASRKESFTLFVLSWILFTISAIAYWLSDDAVPVAPT